MSKGSTPRPFSVANEEYANRWDEIFGIKKDPKTLAEHVWNDQMKKMQSEIDKKMIEGEKK